LVLDIIKIGLAMVLTVMDLTFGEEIPDPDIIMMWVHGDHMAMTMITDTEVTADGMEVLAPVTVLSL
jgi:hypothetical protein